MKRNKRINRKMSVNTEVATHLGAIIALFCLMVIVNILASSGCQQMLKRIGEDEKELARLEDSRNRELTRWEEMKTPEKVNKALVTHGMAMKPPRPVQVVRMSADGFTQPNQISVAEARKRRTMGLASTSTVATQTRKRGR